MPRYVVLIISTLIFSSCVSSLVWVATQQSVKAEIPKESKKETIAITNKPVKIPKTAAAVTALDTTSTINATSTAEETKTLSAETTQTLFISEVTATVPAVETTFTSLTPLSITGSETTETAPSDTATSTVLASPEQDVVSAQPSQDSTSTAPSPFAIKGLSTRDLAASVADKYAIPQNLFFALIKQESGWNYKACSRVGALGLTQVMPFNITAMGYDVETFKDSPVLQLELGARILSENFSTFGRWDYALAAYNAGPNAVIKYGGIPPYEETTNYVRSILAMAEQYESESKQ
ncbi:MAG: transglycosylase SLT domain-containing protein [Firmicutes bacterium]|nr:transglycosylase SLT domain-containing protein [Bacillota bacterium]